MPENPIGAAEANALARAIQEAAEQAAMSGLCYEGQMEMAVAAARPLCPDLDDTALRELVAIEMRSGA